MKNPKITYISISEIKNDPKYNYQIKVKAERFDSKRHRIILKVNGKYYDQLENYNTQKIFLPVPQKNNFFPFSQSNSQSVEVYAQIFDFKTDKVKDEQSQILETKRQLFEQLGRNSFFPKMKIDSALPQHYENYWHANRKVTEVIGPKNSKGEIVTKLEANEQYTFIAKPNKNLNNVELLSVKWAYSYDGGEITLFKNNTENVIGNENVMTCSFHAEPNKIKVYAYFFEPSEKVSVEFVNFGKEQKVNEVREDNLLDTQNDNNEKEKNKQLFFPFLVRPENDDTNKWKKKYDWTAEQGKNMATFNANRSKGKRKHAARDLYSKPYETVVSICDGEVLDVRTFYMGTSQVTVKHWTLDGRNFIVRYGELDPKSIKVKEKEIVTPKKEIGKTGFLQNEDGSAFLVRDKTVVYMLHFELYSGKLGFDLKKQPLTASSGKYLRRGDLLDPIDLLKEGYKNSFETNRENKKDNFFTINDATKALKKVYLLYGREMAQTIESMYRWECSHFKSVQYKNCGAPGMEVSGNATFPNYGWDGSLYIKHPEYSPIGTWEAFENKGMSGLGGNDQVVSKKKKYIKFPSVEAGMMYLVNFIERHNGNVGRWHSTDAKVQENYVKNIASCTPKIVNSFEK